MKFVLASLSLTLALSGCASNFGATVNMFQGDLTNQQVATLNPLPVRVGSTLLRIDGEAPGSCFVNCTFFRPVRVLPGTRTVFMEVFMSSDSSQIPIMPADRLGQATPLKTNHSSLLVNSAVVDTLFTFEAGKTYQLGFGFRSKDDHAPYIWWEVSD
ncbi:hypothetical protein ACPRNU_24805, partial [Chromobacterium vaccinii]|uniref:hypothetical protein n=1 Tax=Chromobacterium vaccinii TaxID=1108595 RepID=UPI003C7256A2